MPLDKCIGKLLHFPGHRSAFSDQRSSTISTTLARFVWVVIGKTNALHGNMSAVKVTFVLALYTSFKNRQG